MRPQPLIGLVRVVDASAPQSHWASSPCRGQPRPPRQPHTSAASTAGVGAQVDHKVLVGIERPQLGGGGFGVLTGRAVGLASVPSATSLRRRGHNCLFERLTLLGCTDHPSGTADGALVAGYDQLVQPRSLDLFSLLEVGEGGSGGFDRITMRPPREAAAVAGQPPLPLFPASNGGGQVVSVSSSRATIQSY